MIFVVLREFSILAWLLCYLCVVIFVFCVDWLFLCDISELRLLYYYVMFTVIFVFLESCLLF